MVALDPQQTVPVDFLTGNASQPTATKLSETDLVARQLFSDYIDMHKNGQTSTVNLNELASRYAQGIIEQTPAVSTKKIDVTDVLVVPDSEESLYVYGGNMLAVRAKYAKLAEQEYLKSGAKPGDDTGAFENFAKVAADLYKTSAEEVLKIPVPTSLTDNHVEIVNNYYESAGAMDTIAEATENPINAFAAINIQTANAQKEGSLFLNIQVAMMANGLTP